MTGQPASPARQGKPTAPLPVGKFFLTTVILCFLITTLWALLRLTPIIETAKAVISAYNPKLAWYFSRASGIVSYLMLTISVVWGLILSTKISKEYTPAPAVLALHNAVGWIAVGIGAMHGFSLMLDTYFTYDLFDILIPFKGPYKPVWVGLGTLSLYIMLLASASFAWKDWLGQRVWRILHYCTFGMYGLVTLHGLMAGTDSWTTGTNLMYVGSMLIVLFLTNYRVIAGKEAAARRSGTEGHQTARPAMPASSTPASTMPEANGSPDIVAPRTSRSTNPEAEARRAAAKERAAARQAAAASD
jgi:methionine sulfoxide reductase heme-binding subunit